MHYNVLLLFAGFAVNLDFLLSKPAAKIDIHAERGFLESSLLVKLLTGLEELEPLANDCSKVCVFVIEWMYLSVDIYNYTYVDL